MTTDRKEDHINKFKSEMEAEYLNRNSPDQEVCKEKCVKYRDRKVFQLWYPSRTNYPSQQ